MTKEERYKLLVEKRKSCSICEGLTNPSVIVNGKYDSNQIGPWSLWQGNLNAELLIVGQDWGDVDYFKNCEGRDQQINNPTNDSLRHLLEILNIKIKNPRDTQEKLIFMTNLILCLKRGGLQASIERKWIKNCSTNFLKQLIEIINPAAVLALGKEITQAIFTLYGLNYPKGEKFSEVVSKNYSLTEKTVLFPVYHCGAKSTNMNRPMKEQEKDWHKIREWLEKNKEA